MTLAGAVAMPLIGAALLLQILSTVIWFPSQVSASLAIASVLFALGGLLVGGADTVWGALRHKN